MMKEVIPIRNRSSRRQVNPHLSHSIRHPPSFQGLAKITHVSQRRHSSNASDTQTSTPTAMPDPAAIAWHKFFLHMNVPVNEFDAEETWSMYDALREHGKRDSLSLEELLSFADKLVMSAEGLFDRADTLDDLHKWGQRIQELMADTKPQIIPASIEDHRWQCLLIRAIAMAGDIDQATALARQLWHITAYKDKSDVLAGYETIIKSLWRHHGAARVLDFLVLEWSFLGSHLNRRSARAHVKTTARHSHLFRHTAHEILATIMNPGVILAERQDLDQDRRLRTGELLIEALCIKNFPEDAVAVLEEMERQLLDVQPSLKLSLVRALVRADAFELANSLFGTIVTKSQKVPNTLKFKFHVSTGLYLFAHQGDVKRTQQYWNQLQENGWVSTADIAMLLQANAVHGNTREVVRLFHEFFPPPTDNFHPPYLATIVHYTVVIYAHARRCDFEGMNAWLETMSKAGITPDEYVYNVILKSFAQRGEVDSVAALLDQMRSAGMQPSAVSYTTAITLLAQRRDPVAAESLYKRALREGVVPDRRMVTSLMNAHVEAASWHGVIRAFDYLKSTPTRHLRLSIEVYNTLFKAYVLIGAPFHVVSNLFDKLKETNVRPNGHTFALLIQSACDAGRMDVASDIFLEMDKLGKNWESCLHIDVYILTIIMSGFLRIGDKIRAKAVYDEMRTRDIQPTSITFGAILKAYGNENTEASLLVAENFLKSLMETEAKERPWIKPTGGRRSALEHVYSPLINVYARRDKPEDVERLFQSMLDAGGEATLEVLTILLYAYHRAGNVDAVLQVWPQVFQLGLRHARVDSLLDAQNKFVDGELESESKTARQTNILCVPLSIYIDALSQAGMHSEIATVWKKMQMNGFAFDSHNWNHLAIALVRAGEAERAFEVLEKVILPYQSRSEHILTERDEQPETPLTFDLSIDIPEGDSHVEPAFEGPSHTANRRSAAVKLSTRKSRMGLLVSDEEHKDDFAHLLHMLYQKSPSWGIWRPHEMTLSVLARVLMRLQSGMPAQPVGPGQETWLGDEDETKRQARVEIAASILGRIYANSPHAVHAVQQHERKRRRRM